MVEVVAVDRPDVVEADLLEQRAAADDDAAAIFLGLPGALVHELGKMLGELLGVVAQRQPGLARRETREISGQRADRRGDRHVVVVEDDDEPRLQRAGVVHRLVSHARRHRAVTDHRDDGIVAALEVARHGHAEAGGDRGRGMRGAERVVLALRALGEARQAAALTQGADAIAAPGEDLVRIGLMPDVPDQTVARRVECVVQGDRQLDDAETRPEMAAGYRNRADHLRPKFVRQLTEIARVQPAQIFRGLDLVEQRGHGCCQC